MKHEKIKTVGVDSSVYYLLIPISIIVIILSAFIIKYILKDLLNDRSKIKLLQEQAATSSTPISRTGGRGLNRLRRGLNEATSAHSTNQTVEIASATHHSLDNSIVLANSDPALSIDDSEDETKTNKKIGTKKLRKLEMKAEKKALREQEVAEREEKKKRETAAEQKRLAEEEKRKNLEKQIELEQKKRYEEQKRKEENEYQSWKKEFEIVDEGCDQNTDLDKNQNILQEFIGYCRDKKIVLLEDLAAQFKLKVQDVINRIESLVADGTMDGVFDDRGKFIYITPEEFSQVAQYIVEKGRISVTELAQHSNRLIKLDQNCIG